MDAETLSLPNVDLIRERIESAEQEDIRFCLMTCYLYAGRISEVVGAKYPSDSNTEARGPRGSDVEKSFYLAESGFLGREKEIPCVIFNVRTAKRQGKERKIAIPLDPVYEPWAKQLYKYFKDKESELVFPFTRQAVWAHSRIAFAGLTYPIEMYIVKDGEVKTKINEHTRDFRLHALRHLRATELVERYQFSGFDLAMYCGWRLGTIVPQVSRTMERYLSLGWGSYFPKLLKRRI